MNVSELYRYVELITNRNQTSGELSIDEFRLLFEPVNYMILNELLGLPLMGVHKYEESRHVTHRLENLIKHKGVDNGTSKLSVFDSGVADLPSDCLFVSSIAHHGFKINSTVVGESGDCSESTTVDSAAVADGQVEIVSDAVFNSRRANPNRNKHPFCRISGRQILFFHKNIGNVSMTYVRKPIVPLIVTSILGDQEVISITESGVIDWPTQLHSRFGDLMVEYWNHQNRDKLSASFNQQRTQKA